MVDEEMDLSRCRQAGPPPLENITDDAINDDGFA